MQIYESDEVAALGVYAIVKGLRKRLQGPSLAVEVLDGDDRTLVVLVGGDCDEASAIVNEVLGTEYAKLPQDQRDRVFVAVDLFSQT